MKIYKITNECGDFGKPEGVLDTQLYPECEGTKYDRDVVKKHERRKKKKKKTKSIAVKEFTATSEN